MSFQFLKKLKTKMRVREIPMASKSLPGVLGTMLDAMNLPEGHLACNRCKGYKFEASGFPGGHKVELGCIGCGERFYMTFPVDVDLPQGRYYCRRHQNKAMILIHNVDVVSIGCEACRTELNICLRKSKGIVLADA